MPVTSMDTGTVTAVNAISIQDVEFMPRSKRVRGRCHWNARDSPPNSALRPVAMTTANAEPEITVVPMNTRHAASVNAVSLAPAASSAAASLRTGMLSPVSAPMCYAQVLALRQLAVGRDDVAHDKLFGRNLPLAGTDPPRRRRGTHHGGQRRGGMRASGVVHVSDQTGHHYHEQDDARGHRRAGMVLPP